MTEESKELSWFERNPKKTIFTFVFVCILVLLVATEVILRKVGHRPGFYNDNKYLVEVDSIRVFSGYDADESGIMKVSEAGRQYLDSIIDVWPKGPDTNFYRELTSVMDQEWALKSLAIDYCQLMPKTTYSNQFLDWAAQLEAEPADSLGDFEEAVLDYYHMPINANGFRSIEFKQYRGNRKKVMLIGDSFTWGLSAKPITSCFADQLLMDGYVVYNMGVVGVDPAQYMAIADKYIPELKPDILIVNYFMGNDVMFHYREPRPYQMPIYPTNAGWLMADRLIDYMTPEEAYRYIQTQKIIPDQDKKWFNSFMAQTVIGSRSWLILQKLKMVPNSSDEFLAQHDAYWTEERFTNVVGEVYFQKIEEIAQQNNCEYIFTMIEDKPVCNPYLYSIQPEQIFKEVPFAICTDLKDEHYNPCPDGHLNNEGHKVFADFLQNKIDSILAAKVVN